MTTAVRQPDLSVYYALSIPPISGVSSIQNGYIVENSTRPIFSKYDLTQNIGYVTFVSNINTKTALENMTLVLPFGSLSAQSSGDPPATLKPLENSIEVGNMHIYSEQQNNINTIYTILSGNGDFIGSKGYVTITTDDTLTRRVDFWLDKR